MFPNPSSVTNVLPLCSTSAPFPSSLRSDAPRGFCLQISLVGLLLHLYGLVCLMGCPLFLPVNVCYHPVLHPSPPSTPDVTDFFAIPPVLNNHSTQQQISQIHQNSILHTRLLNRIIELLSGTQFSCGKVWTSICIQTIVTSTANKDCRNCSELKNQIRKLTNQVKMIQTKLLPQAHTNASIPTSP